MLVDLPGYGFAKVPDRIQQLWAPLIETFFKSRTNLRGVIMLVDSRRVQDSDRDMMAWISQLHIPMMLVATKADKVIRGKRQGAVREIQEGLGVEDEPIFLSAYTGEGKHQVLNRLRELFDT
jgi:GTP-binding protein